MGNKLLRPNQDNPLDGFNDDQLTYLADKFEVLRNDKGFLDLKNFCQFFKCSQDQGQRILKFIDNEGNGEIDFYEFKCAAASLHQDDDEAQRMIHQIYSNNSQIKPEQFSQLYKTIFLYLKDFGLLKQTQEYSQSFADAKLKQYDYSKNGFLDLKQFSEMLRNDFHCKLWMTTLGFKDKDNNILDRVQKPENDADDFQEEDATGDEAGSTPAWIKTIEYMAPNNPKIPSTVNQTPSSNLDIQYVYGYRSYDTRDNLKYNLKGQAVYHTAALGIVLNQSKNTMKLMDIHNDDITCLDSKDNITVTGEMGKKPLIVVWDNQTMEKIVQFSSPLQHSIACIAISPSKKYLAASSMSDKHEIAIYDIQNKKLVSTGNGPRSVIYALRFNANQDSVAASCAKQVVFAQFKNKNFKLTKGVFGKIPICASFSITSYGGGVVTGMQNGAILVWKGTSCGKPYKQHTSAVTALCETEKGGLVSGDVNGNIFIWTSSLTIEKKLLISKLLKSPSNNHKVISLCMKGNNLLVGTRGGQIIQADASKNPATGNIIMQGHFDKQLWGVVSAAKSNEFFTGGQDKLLLKWDIVKRKLSAKNKCEYQIMSVDYNSKSNILAVGMKNGIVQFYNANSLKKMDTKITLHKNPDKQVISIVKYSPDCSLLAVGYCPPVSKVYFYLTSTNKKVAQCKGCISRITCIDFTNDSASIMLNNTSYEILFFSTNGQQITSAKQFKSNTYDDDNFETLSCKYSWQAQGIWPHLYADGTNINAVQRSHNRKLLASGDDFSKIKLFNYPACVQKQLYNTCRGHSSHITGIKWSYDDQYMISIGGLEKSIIQWKLDKEEELNYQYQEQKHLEPEQEQVDEDEQYQFQGEPQSQVGKQKNKKVKDEDDDFEEQDNEGDQALAVKPFEGQVIYSTPSEYAKIATQSYNIVPKESLKINYAWGIRNQYISDEVRNQLKYSQNGNSCVYFTAALGVQMNLQDQSQTFYNVQSEDLISMSITSDRKIVATGQMAEVDKTNKKIPKVDIHIWNIDNKQPIKQLKGFHQRAIVILEFSPDGTQLLSIGQDDQNTLAVYNWKNNKITWSAPTSKGKATGACWKNNKQYCTIGTDHIKFWTQAKGVMGKLPGKWEAMYSVAFLDGAKYVSGGASGNLFFWNGGSASKIQAHKGKVHTIKIHNGKTVYSGAEDGKIIAWKYNGSQLSKQTEIANLTTVSPLAPGILSIDIHPKEDRMLVCTKSSQIYEFPINKFQNNTCQMKSHFAGQLWTCAFSPDNSKFVTGGDDKTVRVYDVETYKQLSLASTKNIIRAVDWCQKNSDLIIVGDWKGSIYLYDSQLQQLDIGKTRFSKMKPMQSTYWIQDIKFSPDGKHVAFGAHGGRSHVEVFSLDGNKFGSSKVLNVGFTSALLSLDWNVNSDVIVAVSQAYQFKFINLNGDPKQADIKASAMKNQEWASWSNKFGWMVQGIFQQPEYFSIHSVCRDQSQSLIATGGTDQKLKIFKYPVLAPKQKFKQYIGHSSHITRVKFSQDQDYLISTGGNDRTTILWQVIRPNKPKKIQKQKQEQELQQQQQEDVQDKDNDDDNQTNLSQRQFDNDIDIPRRAMEQKQQQVEDEDEFAQEDNEGDQFMAILPFKGALVAPTVAYKQNSGKVPKVKIQIQYAYGYRTKDCRNNLKFIDNNTISYHTAALGVIMNISSQPQQQQFFNKHTDDILSMCWSDDKKSMFTGEQGPKCLIHQWNNSGDLIKTYKGMIKGTVALACNDKYLAAAGMDDDHIIIVFDRKTGAKYATEKGGKQFIVALQFVNQNTFVSVGIKHYKQWTIEKNKITASKGSFQKNNNLLTCAKVKQKKILAGAGDGTLQVWQGTSITTSKKLHSGKPLQAICCLENVILTGGKDKKINILDNKYNIIKTLNCQQLLQNSVCPQIRAIDVLDDKLLVGTISSQIYQLKCSDNINQATAESDFEFVKCVMTGHYAANAKWTNEVWGLSLMQKDDEFVTCSDDSTVRVWNMKKRQQTILQRLDLDKNNKTIAKNKITGDFQQSAKGRCIAVSEDKYVLVGCKEGTLRIFNPKLKQIGIMQITNKQISDIKFSPDNKYVAIGAHDSKIYIYEWDGNGKLNKVATMKGHHSTITHIDFSKDGNYIHSNSRDYELLFWDTMSGKQLTSGATSLRDEFFHTWTSCIGWPVEGIWEKFSKGTDINAVDRTKQSNPYTGQTLLCVGDDFGKVRLLQYPVRTKNSQSVDGSGHSSHVTCVRFDNNDKRIISTGGQDQTIIQWKITR